jgi:D-alanyl-D-alanine carboxypeptidase
MRTGRNGTHCPSIDYGGIMVSGSIKNVRTLGSVHLLLGVFIRMNTRLASLGISSELITARGLSEFAEATKLDIAEVGADGRDHLLVPAAAEAWRRLKAAALAACVDLFIVSAFRSIDRQAEIVRRKLEGGATVESILTVCAPPGFSEHHTGKAVDLSTSGSRLLEVEFDQTPAYAWLTEHASEFGYYLSYPVGNSWGYQYEPWHWCFQDAQPSSQQDAAR